MATRIFDCQLGNSQTVAWVIHIIYLTGLAGHSSTTDRFQLYVAISHLTIQQRLLPNRVMLGQGVGPLVGLTDTKSTRTCSFESRPTTNKNGQKPTVYLILGYIGANWSMDARLFLKIQLNFSSPTKLDEFNSIVFYNAA